MDRTTRSRVWLALSLGLAATLGCQPSPLGQARFAIGPEGPVAPLLATADVPVPGESRPAPAIAELPLPAPLVPVARSAGGGSSGGAFPVVPRTTGELTVSFKGLLPAAAARRVLATVADIDHVKVIITPEGGLPVSQDVTKAQLTAGVTSVTFTGLPAGPAKVTIYAFDASDNVIGTSSQDISVVSGVTTTIAITVTLNPTYTPAPGAINTTITFIDGPVVPGIPPGTVLGIYQTGTAPEAIAFDASGNVLVANFEGSSVTMLSPGGTALGTIKLVTTGKVYATSVQVDLAGNIWVGDYHGHQARIFDATGAPAAPLAKMPVGPYPSALAFDATGSLWATNYLTKSVTRFAPTGAPLGSYPVGEYPIAIDFDPAGNAWVINFKSCDVTVIDPLGALIGTYALGDGSEPSGIAIDAAGDAWITLNGTHQVVRYRLDGTKVGAYDVGQAPRGIAIDNAGNAWVANNQSDTLTRLSPDGILLGHHPVGDGPKAIRKDPAGYLWVTNYADNTVMKIQP